MFAFYKLSTRIASSSYQTSNVAGRDDTVLAHHHADTHMYMYIVDRYMHYSDSTDTFQTIKS